MIATRHAFPQTERKPTSQNTSLTIHFSMRWIKKLFFHWENFWAGVGMCVHWKFIHTWHEVVCTYPFLIAHQCYISWVLCVAGRFWAPQPNGHLNIHKTDDTERYKILHSCFSITHTITQLSSRIEMIEHETSTCVINYEAHKRKESNH